MGRTVPHPGRLQRLRNNSACVGNGSCQSSAWSSRAALLPCQRLPLALCIFHVSFLTLSRLIAFQLLEEMQKNSMFNFNLGKRLGSSLASSLLSIRFSQG